MELKDTVDLMLSDDYKDRFIAEVDQLKIRIFKLENILESDSKDTLGFDLTCPRRILEEQLKLMNNLYWIMVERAKCEGIDIS